MISGAVFYSVGWIFVVSECIPYKFKLSMVYDLNLIVIVFPSTSWKGKGNISGRLHPNLVRNCASLRVIFDQGDSKLTFRRSSRRYRL